MSLLTDRLRGIVGGAVPRVSPELRGPCAPDGTAPSGEQAGRFSEPAREVRGLNEAGLSRAAAELGGCMIAGAYGRTIVVERHYAATSRHGRMEIGEIAEVLLEGEEALRLLTAAWPASATVHAASGAGVSARPAHESCAAFTQHEGSEAEGPDIPSRLRQGDGGQAREGLSRSLSDDRSLLRSRTTTGLWFLDLETTGLAGGAGTQAFLVGCACLDEDGFTVRQFLLPGYEHERALLAEVGAWAAERGAIVTFNGRSFDVPLIETRYLFHRQPFPLEGRAHVDMLHPARRLWRVRGEWEGSSEASCSLGTLEKLLAGVHRVGDVPGFEIPSRYFQFVRDGDARPLEAVLEHNRLDLVSLALVMARALTLVERGPSAAQSAYECLGLARIYDRAGRRDDAEAAYVQAIDRLARIGRDPETLGDALRRLAYCRRRAGRWREAAETWQWLADLPRCPAALRHEAREALAIYHEHRARDLDTAHAHARQLIREPANGRQREAAAHRLRRLERKLARKTMGSSLWPEPDDELAF